MPIDFNTEPYFDDFDARKKFYKILFKPANPVQARELNQIQSSLQKQLESLGGHIFKDGAVVLNGSTFYDRVRVLSVTSNGTSAVSVDTLLANKDRVFISTSGMQGRIVGAKVDAGNVSVYYIPLSGVDAVASQNFTFLDDDSYAFSTSPVGIFSDIFATRFSINQGVFFVNGYFVLCEAQSIFLGEDDLLFSSVVGLQAIEKIITTDEDDSLFDNAIGSPNFQATGADRYFIDLKLVSYDFDSVTKETLDTPTNFIELSRFENGELVTISKDPSQYNEIDRILAQRTYDESGDYTVRPFKLAVEKNINNKEAFLTLNIDAGKAYVKGYDFETIAPTRIDLERARDTIAFNGYGLSLAIGGGYVMVDTVTGAIDLSKRFTVNVQNVSNVTIGTATVRHMEFDATATLDNIYRLYIENVTLNAGVSFTDVRRFTTSGFNALVRLDRYTDNKVKVTTVQPNIVKMNSPWIKSYLNDLGQSDTQFVYSKRFEGITATTSGGNATSQAINTGSANETFIGTGTLPEVTTNRNYHVVVRSAVGVFTAGQVLKYSGGLRISVTGGSSITIVYPSASNLVLDVVAKVSASSVACKTKTITSRTDTFNGVLANKINLTQADGYEITRILATRTGGTTDVTNRYEFNDGQTDSVYELANISLRNGFVSPHTDLAGFTNIQVTYRYFTHTGVGFFNVDSYTTSNIGNSQDETYKLIPTYKTSAGEILQLRDCFDFRPRRLSNGTISNDGAFGVVDSILTTDFSHYIGRYDKLILTKERKFIVVKGVSSNTPVMPSDLPEGMTLYKIRLSPFTARPTDVTLEYIDHRRYTMRDIGAIEKRVQRVEYYTTLSLLEKQAEDEKIPSNIAGLERFKNGILVDSFAGHSVGDVSNPDYSCSIDYEKRILRPRFTSQSFGFKKGTINNVMTTGDLITLRYTPFVMMRQPSATRTVNLNPFSVFNYNGMVRLSPSSDNWIDTTTKPDVVVNINGENDAFTILADNVNNPQSVGVRWSDWTSLVKGNFVVDAGVDSSSASVKNADGSITINNTVSSTITTSSVDAAARVGLEISKSPITTIQKDLGTKVVDLSVAPFIRSRIVDFFATGLKPSTVFYSTFDGIDVTDYCSSALELKFDGVVNLEADEVRTFGSLKKARIIGRKKDRLFVNVSTALFADGDVLQWYADGEIVSGATITVVGNLIDNAPVLYTNENGDLAGSFYIPNNHIIKFKTGDRIFKLLSSIGHTPESQAEFLYVANGLSQSVERTVLSTRVQTVSISPTIEGRSSSTSSTTTSSNTTTVVIPPPPPPPPPFIPVIACNQEVITGNQGTYRYIIEFGTDIGVVGINHFTGVVPDRYTIIWDGKTYTSGFVGAESYNAALNAAGFPNVSEIASGSSRGNLTFLKNKIFPTTATVIVDAPLRGTGWNFNVICPIVGAPDLSPKLISFCRSFNKNFTATESSNARNGNVVLPVGSVAAQLSNGTDNTVVPNMIITPNVGSHPFITAAVTSTGADTQLKSTKNYNIAITLNLPRITGRYRTNRFDYSFTLSASGKTTTCTGSVSILIHPSYVDPVAQTFFVDSETYPNGMFLDSVDLFFAKTSPDETMFFQIRPTVNGFPSSSKVLPFGIVEKEGSDILVSANGSVATNFKFESPVYLSPNEEYCFVAGAYSTSFEIFTAAIGDNLLDRTEARVTEQPAIGSMFKSQNASTWTPIQEEDVKFVLNGCEFDTTQGSIELVTNANIIGDVEYDVLYVGGETLDFAGTEVSYKYRTTNMNNTQSPAVGYQKETSTPQDQRKKIRSQTGTDLVVTATMSTEDRFVTPVIDIARLSSIVVKNLVNDDFTNELNAINGLATSKYISRKVILADGFESEDLRVYLDAKLPQGSSIKVYYRAATATQDGVFEQLPWYEMNQTGGTFVEGAFVEYKYDTNAGAVIVNGSGVPTGEKFKTYSVKIVMLSSIPVNVPEVRALRVIALDE